MGTEQQRGREEGGRGKEEGKEEGGRGETKLQRELEAGRGDGGESPWVQPFLIYARGLPV